MTWFWRLLLTVYNLGLLALGTAMIATAAGNQVVLNSLTYWFANPWERVWAGAVGGLLLILGMILIVLTLRREASDAVLVKDGANGQIFITIPAVEQVVLKSARALPGVRETRPVIKNIHQGLKIYLHLLVVPDTIVPELTANLQQVVKADVERMVGVPVLEVRVLVDDTEKRERR